MAARAQRGRGDHRQDQRQLAQVARSDSVALNAARTWGSTPAERQAAYPCDRQLARVDDQLFRAIDVDAPAAVTFRWLCQLRIAPYSYDLIDNRGRRSPKTLKDGLDRLETGQRFMRIFELVEFEHGCDLTLRIVRGENVFGNLAVTYRVVPTSEDSCRLVVKIVVADGFGRLPDRLAPTLDLFMMRKQLLNLKKLAEAEAGAPRTLAFVDERCIDVAATPVDVWTALEPVVKGIGNGRLGRAYARAVGCRETDRTGTALEPGATIVGFRVADSNPPRSLSLEGRHRASDYKLAFEIRPVGKGSRLCARTNADFPGLVGGLYRAAVIGTGGHKVATRSMLRAIKRRAERSGQSIG